MDTELCIVIDKICLGLSSATIFYGFSFMCLKKIFWFV